jgi:hypothetical protein
MVRRDMVQRFKAWLGDRRGAYELIQFGVILPIFVIILYGSFELLKLISIRQSLDTGTYQAARYLSVYHRYYSDSRYNRTDVDDTARAELLIRDSILANQFVSPDTPIQLVIRYYNGAGQEIPTPVDFPCWDIRNALDRPDSSNLIFTVRTQLTIPWYTSVLGLSMGNVTLTSAHTSFIDCGPWYPPPRGTPTPTPTATPLGGG